MGVSRPDFETAPAPHGVGPGAALKASETPTQDQHFGPGSQRTTILYIINGCCPGAADMKADWDDRELVEVVQLNILKITDFLNKFDRSVRYRLSKINERVTTLERSLQHCEAAIRSSKATEDDDGPGAGDEA